MQLRTKATLAVIAGNAIFGFSFLFSRLALNVTEPLILIATRFTAAFLIMNLVVLIGRKLKNAEGGPLLAFSLKGKPKKDILLMAFFQPILYFAAENYGLMYTSSSFAGIIIAMVPLAGILMDLWFMHRRVTKTQLFCACISVLGVGITSIGSSDTGSSLKGLVFLLGAVFAGSIYFVFSKRAAVRYSPFERTYVMFGCGSAVYVLLAIARCAAAGTGIVTAAFTSPVFWLAILYLSCISSVVAFLLLNFGGTYVSVSEATLYANLTTVISIFAGVLILKEEITPLRIAGAAMIIIGVYLAQISANRQNRSSSE